MAAEKRKRIVIEVLFDYDDFVYLKTDPDQNERQVIEIGRNTAGALIYTLACGADEPTTHYEDEISATKKVF